MRGDKRVAVRFNLVARKASAEVKPQDYSQKYDASDNLKWSLSGERWPTNQQPLGRPAASGGAGRSIEPASRAASWRLRPGANAISTSSRMRSSRPSIAT